MLKLKPIKQFNIEEPWLDFSTLKLYMQCPRAYYWRMHQHLFCDHPALAFGTAVHNALAVWFKNDEKNDEKALVIFAQGAREIKIEDSKRNLTVGFNLLTNYFNRWREEEYETLDTDVGFAIEIGLDPFLFIGKIDRIVRSRNYFEGVGAMEHKTSTVVGNRWNLRTNPNLQMEGYIAALSELTQEPVFGSILDVLYVHEDSKKMKPSERFIKTQYDNAHWARNIALWFQMIQQNNKQMFHPQNTESCHPLIGMSCSYDMLCSLYPDPYEIEAFDIPEHYQREVWHPLINKVKVSENTI